MDKDPTFLGQVLAWVAAGIAAVGAWLWAHTMGRIDVLEKDKVDRKEFEAAMSRVDRQRDELRGNQADLFGKVDELRNHFDAKFDRMFDLIRAKERQ